MSPAELPAATTYTTPLATDAQIALWSTSRLVRPHVVSGSPLMPRLRLATRMPRREAFAVTHSIPQRREDDVPRPSSSSTFTAYTVVPGATPMPFFPPIVPATCVP